jgi:protein-tyrosine phosphatase
LSDLKKEDLNTLANLNLKSVIDMRSDYERNEHPDDIISGATYYHTPIGDKEGHTFQKLKKDIIKKRVKGEQAKRLFLDLMEGFTDSVTQDFKPVVDLLLKDEAPMVYHCSGGKDRTGFISAMILSALGVDRETIRKDYLVSNFYRQDLNQKRVNQVGLIGIDDNTAKYLFLVHNDYFDAVFNIIDEKYGDIDNYLEIKFGLTPELRQQLIERYTFRPEDFFANN